MTRCRCNATLAAIAGTVTQRNAGHAAAFRNLPRDDDDNKKNEMMIKIKN